MGPGAKPVLSLRHVGASYWLRKGFFRRRRFWALKDISFDLYRGESLGVIGRNGCGKSTLLKILAGITRPDKGSISGQHLSATLLALQLGFLPYLTGRENAMLSGMMLGLTRPRIAERIEAIAEFAELGDFFDEPISEYSAGMRARLGFAVAFQLDPDILLIDEVLGVGDAQFREKSTAVMTEKIRSDKTVVLVSHSAETLLEFCDRAVWLEDGCTRAVGPAEEVVMAYWDAFEPRRRTRRRPKVEPVRGHAANDGTGVDGARIDKGTDVADAVAPRDAVRTAQGDGVSTQVHAATGGGEKCGRGPRRGP
ncbi:MAG: ABC transporter ATP-binding protein [Gammaproteobacteria bacterium]